MNTARKRAVVGFAISALTGALVCCWAWAARNYSDLQNARQQIATQNDTLQLDERRIVSLRDQLDDSKGDVDDLTDEVDQAKKLLAGAMCVRHK